MARQPTFQSTISRIVPPLCRFVIAHCEDGVIAGAYQLYSSGLYASYCNKALDCSRCGSRRGKKAPYLGLNEASCLFSCAYTCICIFLLLSLDWSLTVACSPERKIKSRNSRCACECGRTCPRKQIQEEERWKVLSAQQLVTRKVLRVGQRSLPV